jgi:hypothetical protein
MVGGVETSCHTRLPSLNYVGSNVQPSERYHSLTHSLTQASPLALFCTHCEVE